MAIHRVTTLEISSVCFSDFNQGKEVAHTFSIKTQLSIGQWFWWKHLNATGTAELISVIETKKERIAVIKKVY